MKRMEERRYRRRELKIAELKEERRRRKLKELV